MSVSFIRTRLPHLAGVENLDEQKHRELLGWLRSCNERLGPTSSVRAIADVAATPLLRLLGYEISARREDAATVRLTGVVADTSVTTIVSCWGSSLDTVWRQALTTAVACDARWCFCLNGVALRIVDAHRSWSRRHLEFDLLTVIHDPEALATFWRLTHASALRGPEPLLDRVVDLSAKHGVAVCRALSTGVLEALRAIIQNLAATTPLQRHSPSATTLLEQALTILYRILFLLFAEARALVPLWHPIYRERYTVDALVTGLMARRQCRGVWQAIQAISRLAHAGCRAGDLRVTPFNGRLFSPVHVPSAERARIDDETIGGALLAMSTTRTRGCGVDRISYHDLDVEQLGAVYEQVLDYETCTVDSDAARPQAVRLVRTGDLRKASGTFYTPRSVTDFLVRRSLEPLVRDRPAEEILSLRILDPAMGSGAFLVSACRYLAAAAEAARIRDGEWHPADVTEADRIELQRDIAQGCLFGVDINPMAVQLARLSLWLATLAGDKPLTFLDHNLVVGDSLVGASPDDLARQPPVSGHHTWRAALPLFGDDHFRQMLSQALPARWQMTRERDHDVQTVRRKEAVLAAMQSDDSAWARWRAVLDLWCACWFWRDGPQPTAALYGDLADSLLYGRSALPSRTTQAWLTQARATAGERRFFHWELVFPEVFFDERGQRRPDAGFDGVLGNPPWDVVRGDSGEATARADRRTAARQLVSFVQGSGIYAAPSRSHMNRFQLFVERAVQLARSGGRIGLVLPFGLLADTGCGPLRRYLFERVAIDGVLGLDNRGGVFPIHRSVRFVLLTATAGVRTERISCRFGVTAPDDLDAPHETAPLVLTRALLERLSGCDDLGLPELLSVSDLRLVERITAQTPPLGSPHGWHVQFGRELNATDDRHAFVPRSQTRIGRLVLEGKHIEPFRVHLERCSWQVGLDAAEQLKAPRRARLAYRDVASATNRLTLIAAIVPARVVTTHTLFVLRSPLSHERQLVLCALLNSYVANYLIRLRVNTHVTTALMSRLPVPFVGDADPTAQRLAVLCQSVMSSSAAPDSTPAHAELQALAAHAYGVSENEFRYVLSTFRLIPDCVKDSCLRLFLSNYYRP